MTRPIVAVDFDGTVALKREFPDIGPPNPMAIDWLLSCRDEFKARLILWTCRGGEFLPGAVDWCEARGLRLDDVNARPDQRSPSAKIHAHVYVDDLALGCPTIVLPGESKPCVDWRVAGPMLYEACRRIRTEGR